MTMGMFEINFLCSVTLVLLSQCNADDPVSHAGRLSSQHIIRATPDLRYPNLKLHIEWCLRGRKEDKFCSGDLRGYYTCGWNI